MAISPVGLNKSFNTHRFCKNCLKNTKFVFNEATGHSECSGCGKYEAINPNRRKAIKAFLEGYKRGYNKGREDG